jgi:hypothetical protein
MRGGQGTVSVLRETSDYVGLLRKEPVSIR